MATQITYAVRPPREDDSPRIEIVDTRGRVTTLSDTLAWSFFLRGCATAHQIGIEVTVIDHDGRVLVGNIATAD